MVDVVAGFGAATQASAAFNLTRAARDFDSSRSALSGLRLVDTVAASIGLERLTGQIVKYAVKLALRSDHTTEKAAADMVELMRSRVPVDSGRLLNGITWRKEGRTVIVEASAVHPDSDYDYALAVEAGHHAGGTHADASLFADTSGRGIRHAKPSHPVDVPAEPYFWGSARETLARWRDDLSAAATTAQREEF